MVARSRQTTAQSRRTYLVSLAQLCAHEADSCICSDDIDFSPTGRRELRHGTSPFHTDIHRTLKSFCLAVRTEFGR
jgi:hypothetical protein